MKYVIILPLVALAFLLFVQNGYAACSYSSEAPCKSANCFWCDRCFSNQQGLYNQINNYGADRCVESSLACTYSCSKTCGAQCETNTDCAANLTDTYCNYNAICSVCNCVYQKAYCPKAGTLKDGTCYFGDRQCGFSGCSIRSCQLKSSHVCDPDNGCVSCGQSDCGTNGEYVEEYRCVNNDVFAKKVIYTCNATECLYTKSDTFTEKCNNGCSNGKCNDELCNTNGVLFDCNRLDGYYSRLCQGNEVYGTYRNYSCISNECQYTSANIKQETCAECMNGVCVEPAQIVYLNYTIIGNSFTNVTGIKTMAMKIVTAIVGVAPSNYSGRLYNGFFFGSNEIKIATERGKNGKIYFTVNRANKMGKLVVQAGNDILFASKTAAGTYIVPFNNSADMFMFYTTSSGWLFYTPSTYDLSRISVSYD